MKRITAILVALALWLITAVPVYAQTPQITVYSGDNGGGDKCTGMMTWDPQFGNGINADGPGCAGVLWSDNIESISFHFHSSGVCWIFYTGNFYSGQAYVFKSSIGDGLYELPGVQDNIFQSYSIGSTANQTSCLAHHP